MEHEPPILFEKLERVALIRLNRPHVYNALNDELMDALTEALDDCAQDAQINCVVITGSAQAFAAGADISTIAKLNYQQAYKEDLISRNWERLRTFRKPVVAAVSGLALGGGCELAMMCDTIFAAENAKFGLPEVKIGTIPGAGGTQRIPRSIGKAKAMDMCLTGRSMDAQEAERSGLVARIFPTAQLLAETLKIAQTIASYSQPVLMMMKESVNRAFESPLQEGILFERRSLHAAFALHDQKEGMQAFLEKRSAIFKDC